MFETFLYIFARQVEKQADNLDQSRDKFKQELAEKKSLEARMEAVDR